MGDSKRRVVVCALVLAGAAAFADRAGADQAATVAEDPARARELEKSLQTVADILGKVKPLDLDGFAQATAGRWGSEYVERLRPTLEVRTAMEAAAKERRAADLALAALRGHLVLDALLADLFPDVERVHAELLALNAAKKKDNRALLERAKDVNLGVALQKTAVATLDVYDFALEAVAKDAPSSVQAAVFEAVAARLPEAKVTRPRLEAVLRTGHDRQTDATARKTAADRMLALEVPLVAPAPSPSPASAAR